MDHNQCFNCGGDLREIDGRIVCVNCGTYVPKQISNEEIMLLTSACQKLRLANFSEAEAEFEDITRRHPKCAQAYWGRLLAKYGIKYEEDYDGRRIPTCYAASIESVFDSSDYQKALMYADAQNQAVYKQHAQYIERCRKDWIEKARKQEPYDIFISYKDSDRENGIDRTMDSFEAESLYYHLQNEGYRVFFSRESLKNNTGEKYEPYIFNALSTAKVLIVYGSKPEYINSTWVKNEWTRYLKRMRDGEKKQGSLVVAYKGFSPYELPGVLSSMQLKDVNDTFFYTELLGTIKRVITDHAPEETKPDVDASDLEIMRARRSHGASIISNVGVKGTNSTEDIWPNTPYVRRLSLDEYSYLRFHCIFMKTVGAYEKKKVGYQIFDKNGSLVYEHETQVSFEPSHDRCSLSWTVNAPNTIPVAPGKYTALLWVGDSRAFECSFHLTSSLDDDGEDYEDTSVKKSEKNEIQVPHVDERTRASAKKEIADIERKLLYPQTLRWGWAYLFVGIWALIMALLAVAGEINGFGVVVMLGVCVLDIFVFVKFYKKTRIVMKKGKMASFLLVLFGTLYGYMLHLIAMTIVVKIRRKKLLARLNELKSMTY